MQSIFNIEPIRVQQVVKVRKLFPFILDQDTITYQIQSSMNLERIIIEQHHCHNKIKTRNTLFFWFRIFYEIKKQLVKLYQIVNVSKLNKNNIVIEFSIYDEPIIHFINLHEKNNLLSYDQNFTEIQQLCLQSLLEYQKQLINCIHDDKYAQEQKNQIIQQIHSSTTLSNEFLLLLKTDMHLENILQFLTKYQIKTCEKKVQNLTPDQNFSQETQKNPMTFYIEEKQIEDEEQLQNKFY